MRFDTAAPASGFRLADFRDVDGSGAVPACIALLERLAGDFHEMVDCSVELLRLRPGAAVLDVGCGHGALAPALAARVGPGGRVQGVDLSRALVAEARRRLQASGLPVAIDVGDAQALEFPDASFDAVRADRVLIFVPRLETAVRELARVTRPGGRVVVTEADLGAGVVDAADSRTTREVLAAAQEDIANPWVGRQLRRQFIDAGLRRVDVRMFPALSTSFTEWSARIGVASALQRAIGRGGVPPERGLAWLEALRERDERGRFLAASTFFVVSGERA